MKYNTLLQSPGGEWTLTDCCQTAFRAHGETFDTTLLDSFSGGVDLTKVWWLEEKGICFQSAVEHYIVDIGSKLITLHFFMVY